MGGVVDQAFGAALERNRDHLNARYAQARRTNRGLEPTPFTEYLRVCVEPVVVAAVAAGHGDPTVDRLTLATYTIALELVAAELAGPQGRYPVVSRLWRELFPQIVRFLDDRPRDTIAALTNAVVNLTVEPDVSAQAWLDAMLDLEGEATSSPELLQLGQMLAWRGGMAHLRDGVLAALPSVRPELVSAVFGDIDPGRRWPKAIEARLRVVGSVGNFRGLGGVFESPPRVMQSDGRLFAFDNGACYSVHADRFGAVLKRYGRALPEEPETPSRFKAKSRQITCAGRAARFDAPPGTSSIAVGDDMALVTVEHSHRILIVAEV